MLLSIEIKELLPETWSSQQWSSIAATARYPLSLLQEAQGISDSDFLYGTLFSAISSFSRT